MNLQEWQDEAYKLSEEKNLDLSETIDGQLFVPDYSPSEFIWALQLTREYNLTDNRYYLRQVEDCCCYYCKKSYKTKEIKRYDGEYAYCPFCGVDAVMPMVLSEEQLSLLGQIMFSPVRIISNRID